MANKVDWWAEYEESNDNKLISKGEKICQEQKQAD